MLFNVVALWIVVGGIGSQVPRDRRVLPLLCTSTRTFQELRRAKVTIHASVGNFQGYQECFLPWQRL